MTPPATCSGRSPAAGRDGRHRGGAYGVVNHVFSHLETRRIVFLSVDEHPASMPSSAIVSGIVDLRGGVRGGLVCVCYFGVHDQ